MSPELQTRIARVLGKYDREYHEYRKTVHDPERLRLLDEAHQLFLHDRATDIEEAYYKKIIANAGKVEAARQMRTDGYNHNFVSLMTGLSSVEIDQLG